MKKLIALALTFIFSAAYAVQHAVTDSGSIVLLNDDGTWKLEANDADSPKAIEFNKKTFAKSNNQSFLLKSTKNSSSVWLDPKKWFFKRSDENGGIAEYKFQFKGSDLYAMLITEQIEINPENLTQLALDNAKKMALNANIISREYRVVNGTKLIKMRMNGSAQGTNFSYVGYYFSDKSGSTQLVVYTASNLVDRNAAEIEEFLNGFSAQQ